jgi:hypothetical protein
MSDLDNATLKRVIQKGTAGAEPQAYYSRGSLSASDVSGFSLQGLGYSGIGFIAVGLGIFVVAAILIVRNGGDRAGYVSAGSNCTEIVCPAGAPGPSGAPGPAGPPGQQGPSGATGPQGLQGNNGLPGPEGPMGQCSNTNPSCLQGATGPVGPRGIPGPTGLAGMIGPTGPQGVIGPQGFIGPTGPQGLQGLIGPTGPQGTPGVCGCMNLPLVNITNLNVTNALTLSGSMTCPGGALDASCFGLVGACPDFSTCYLNALGLNINSSSVTVIPQLKVGMANQLSILDRTPPIMSIGLPFTQRHSLTWPV